MYCAKCGAPNADDANFCKSCGASLTGGAPGQVGGGNDDGQNNRYVPGKNTKRRKKPVYKRVWFWILVALVLIIALPNLFPVSDDQSASRSPGAPSNAMSESASTVSGEATTLDPTPEPTPEMARISVKEITEAYDENEVKADGLYKNQRIAVSGIVDNISKDILNDAFVKLTTGKSFEWGVQCYFDDENLHQIENLKPGDEITIIGDCDGKAVLNVMLKKCEVE